MKNLPIIFTFLTLIFVIAPAQASWFNLPKGKEKVCQVDDGYILRTTLRSTTYEAGLPLKERSQIKKYDTLLTPIKGSSVSAVYDYMPLKKSDSITLEVIRDKDRKLTPKIASVSLVKTSADGYYRKTYRGTGEEKVTFNISAEEFLRRAKDSNELVFSVTTVSGEVFKGTLIIKTQVSTEDLAKTFPISQMTRIDNGKKAAVGYNTWCNGAIEWKFGRNWSKNPNDYLFLNNLTFSYTVSKVEGQFTSSSNEWYSNSNKWIGYETKNYSNFVARADSNNPNIRGGTMATAFLAHREIDGKGCRRSSWGTAKYSFKFKLKYDNDPNSSNIYFANSYWNWAAPIDNSVTKYQYIPATL